MKEDPTIRRLLDEALRTRVFSAYQLWLSRGDETWSLHGGMTSYWPDAVPIDERTCFDIGSVTKALVTTSLLARAVSAGKCSLTDPIGKFLPLASPLADIELKTFLSHRTGLTAWVPFFRILGTGRSREEWLTEVSRYLGKPAATPVYSDLGFILLGWAAEKIHGAVLPEAFSRQVLEPLGLSSAIGYGPTERSVTPATEWCLWRKKLLQGEVFDENCAALGGIGGHAGIFASAASMGPWAQAWLRACSGEDRWVRSEVAKEFSRPVAGTWALGWDTPSAHGSSLGSHWSRQSFGHLGYPGASVWIDPESQGIAIFLSNRIHPSRYDERIRKLRPVLHDAIAALWRGP